MLHYLAMVWRVAGTVTEAVDRVRVEASYQARQVTAAAKKVVHKATDAGRYVVTETTGEVLHRARRFEWKIQGARTRWAAVKAVQRIYHRPHHVAQDAYRERFGFSPWEGSRVVDRAVAKSRAVLRGERLRLILKGVW